MKGGRVNRLMTDADRLQEIEYALAVNGYLRKYPLSSHAGSCDKVTRASTHGDYTAACSCKESDHEQA